MTVLNAWQGAVTPTSFAVNAHVTGSSTRLAVADNPGLVGATYVGPLVPDADGIVELEASGLTADTVYYWAIEDDSTLDTDWPGRCRTLPTEGEPASYTVAILGDAGANSSAGAVVSNRVSNHPAFDAILARDPAMAVHLGDIHYRDIGSGTHVAAPFDRAKYLDAYDDVLTYDDTLGADARQGRLYRAVPVAYTWDNHDYGWTVSSSTDADRDLPHREDALAAYRQRVPHYPLPAGEGATAPIYQTWVIGRVRFILLDVRSQKSSNADPDDSSKTMLGQQQREWLETLLSTATEPALVLFSPGQWITKPTESDTWNVFQTEQQLIVSWLQEYGWIDRMCVVSASMHALGIDSGTNAPGGMPAFLFAGIDAVPASQEAELYDQGPTSVQRGQWGTLDVVDTGTQITITGTGWVDTELWRSYSFTIAVDAEEPEPPTPGPAPVAVARIRRRLTWLGVDAVSGRIIAELPDVRGEVSRLVSAYTSTRLTVPIPLAGPGHVPIRLVEQATQPIRSAIVAIVNDLPTWMGWVVSRRGGTDATLELSVVTPEGYLARRRIRDRTYTGVDRALVAAGLTEDAGDIAGVGAGFGFELDVELTGDTVDRTYLLSDRETVYDGLRELAGSGPLEFTVDLDWTSDAQTAVTKILRLKPRIGRTSTDVVFEAVGGPAFESQAGAEATYTLLEDHTDGRGANYIVAYAPGEGEDQPASDPAIDTEALAAGAPIVERHWQPSSSITEKSTLDAHAQQALEVGRGGAQVWEIEARLQAYPRPGVDAMLGDDVQWDVRGHRHPDGVRGRARMMGWSIDHQAGRWKPILLDPQEVTG